MSFLLQADRSLREAHSINPHGGQPGEQSFFPAEAEKVLYQMAGLFVQAKDGNSPTSKSLYTCSLSELRLDWRPHCGFAVK